MSGYLIWWQQKDFVIRQNAFFYLYSKMFWRSLLFTFLDWNKKFFYFKCLTWNASKAAAMLKLLGAVLISGWREGLLLNLLFFGTRQWFSPIGHTWNVFVAGPRYFFCSKNGPKGEFFFLAGTRITNKQTNKQAAEETVKSGLVGNFSRSFFEQSLETKKSDL